VEKDFDLYKKTQRVSTPQEMIAMFRKLLPKKSIKMMVM